MELLPSFISEKILLALGWMIIHALWQIAGIGLLLWLSLQVFGNKSAAFKYRLSVSALAVISVLALGTFIYSIPQPNPEISEAIAYTTHKGQWVQPDYNHVIEAQSNWIILSGRIENWIPTLVQIWFLGALLFLFRFGTSLADLRNLNLKNHESPEPKWMEIFEKQVLSLQLDKPIKFLKTVHVDMPVTYGIWKPVILVPASLFFQLSPTHLEAILAHELAHIKRHDYLVNIIQSCLEVIFFFHPVFWWVNKTTKDLRENACDDMAINMGIAPKDLAYGLANALNFASKPAPEMAMAAAKTKNPTLDRIKRIMGVKTSPTQPTTLSSITMMITLLIGATLMVGASDKKTIESWEDLMTTSITSKTIEGNWEKGFQLWNQDTVPVKKEYKIEVDTTFERPLSPEEMEGMDKILNESDIPWKEMGMVFKDMDFSFFSNMPQIKIGAPMIPPMDFDDMPKWEFDGEMLEQMVPDADFFKSMPIPDFPMIETNLYNFSFNQNFFRNDTSKMSKEEIRKWKENYQVEMEKWAEAQKEFHSKMEPKMKEFQHKMKEWEKANEPKMQEYRLKMEEWQQEFQNNFQPKIEEYQTKMQEWQKANEPKMKEFELKMKAWQEENQPKMDEFQKKMEIWQKENEIKMQEFQIKMQEWQKEHQEKM
jgi:bla regulator protein blaR1